MERHGRRGSWISPSLLFDFPLSGSLRRVQLMSHSSGGGGPASFVFPSRFQSGFSSTRGARGGTFLLMNFPTTIGSWDEEDSRHGWEGGYKGEIGREREKRSN